MTTRVSFRCRTGKHDKISVDHQRKVQRVYVSIHEGTFVPGLLDTCVSLPPKVARALAVEIIRQANLIEGEQP